MAEYRSSTDVAAPVDTVFDYLADVDNLPDYFARMRSAERTGDEEVHTVAEGPHGETYEAEAWFRVDPDRRRLEWGSEGESHCSGHLEVTSDDGGARVEVAISTEHTGTEEVQQGLDATVATIKEKVEQQGVVENPSPS